MNKVIKNFRKIKYGPAPEDDREVLKWINPNFFRIGASSLLIDIERQLYHYALGRYATSHKIAMS